MSAQELVAQYADKIGTEVHTSDWHTVTQEQIRKFAEATLDFQWIHVDPGRAKEESPWGTTIAHGYLTLSLYPYLRNLVNEDQPLYPGIKSILNYGINKCRFPNAVQSGQRIKSHTVLKEMIEVKGGIQTVEEFNVEVEGQERPACVAEVVIRFLL